MKEYIEPILEYKRWTCRKSKEVNNMNKEELTISDKLDIIAMQPMTRETMKFICEIDKEVNLKNYKLNKYKEVLDKIKEIIKKDFDMEINDDFALESIYKLLEEIE